jgi:hypothetical protein
MARLTNRLRPIIELGSIAGMNLPAAEIQIIAAGGVGCRRSAQPTSGAERHDRQSATSDVGSLDEHGGEQNLTWTKQL